MAEHVMMSNLTEEMVNGSEVPKQDWMDDATYRMAVLEELARKQTLERQLSPGKTALIAIKSQHPLTAAGRPGPEFEARLQEALRLAQELMDANLEVKFLTFGGEHAGNEDVTLADAGEAWLLEHEVAPEQIQKIVVYSGNDEDTFAADCFCGDPECVELHVVCSAGQIPRCWLNFSLMGWQPTLHPVTFVDAKPHQSMVCELKGGWSVPAYFKENAAAVVQAATESIRKRHQQELEDQR